VYKYYGVNEAWVAFEAFNRKGCPKYFFSIRNHKLLMDTMASFMFYFFLCLSPMSLLSPILDLLRSA
jgi:hypothetical protein